LQTEICLDASLIKVILIVLWGNLEGHANNNSSLDVCSRWTLLNDMK